MTTPPLDFYELDTLINDSQRQISNRVRTHMKSTVLPVINDYRERAEFAEDLEASLRI